MKIIKSFWNRLLKQWWFIAAVIVIACGSQAPTVLAATITANLTVTYSTSSTVDSSNHWPACSATVTTFCIAGFDLFDTTSGKTLLFQIANATTASGTQTIIQTNTVTPFSYGTHTFVVDISYVGSSGPAVDGQDSLPTTAAYNPLNPGTVILNSITVK
jgi:hypothetical protein